jgi:hypothetical protein
VSDKEYFQYLSLDDRLKVKFTTRNGKVTFFVVQYYAKINGKWKTVMRADNCHVTAHLHTYYLQSKEYKVLLNKENNVALVEARDHISKDFLKIKENYLNN